jgi:hypothetical protein
MYTKGEKYMKSMIYLLSAALLSGCAATSVSQFQAPDGTAIKTVKCNSDSSKCFAAATQSCPGNGTYRVISSASRAGGIAADLLPGPVTWYYMTYACGPSDGNMPDFKFTGQQYIPPPAPIVVKPAQTTTNCTAIGNSVNCTTR